MLTQHDNIVLEKIGPLWIDSQYRDTKDPCPVFDGKRWHVFGSGGAIGGGIEEQEVWSILHASAPAIDGPWSEESTVVLDGLEGKHIAAPGVVYEKGIFHMLVQTEFLSAGGTIKYLTSDDGGATFVLQNTALHSIEGTHEAALYDPHPAIIRGQKYMTYSGSEFIEKVENPIMENYGDTSVGTEGWEPWVGKPDIYLAKSESNTWAGPWTRMGKILDQEEVAHHNQRDHLSYEWGLEGSQLIELPSGIIVMNAVCFLPHGEYGTRQRVFFAFAENVMGPYRSAGTVVHTDKEWESGENGHAAVFMRGPDMVMFYQGRPPKLEPWRYGIAYFDIKALEKIGRSTLRHYKELAKASTQTNNKKVAKLSRTLLYSRPGLVWSDRTRILRATLRQFRRSKK